MADISRIKLPSGTIYDIYDEEGRRVAQAAYDAALGQVANLIVSGVTNGTAPATTGRLFDIKTNKYTPLTAATAYSNAIFASTVNDVAVASTVYIKIQAPDGESAVTVVKMADVPLGTSFYLPETAYPDRWYSTSGHLYGIQEKLDVSGFAHAGKYTSTSAGGYNEELTTSSAGATNTSLSVTGSVEVHTHPVTNTPTAATGSQSIAGHSHTFTTTTASPTGSISVTYKKAATTTGSAGGFTVNGSNFTYDKAATTTGSGGGYTINGSNFKYDKATSASSATSTGVTAGKVTISGSNFKYQQYEAHYDGVDTLSFAYATVTSDCTGQQEISPHTHSISSTSTTATGAQTVSAHTHTISTTSTSAGGEQTIADHSHTIGLTDTTVTATHTLSYVKPDSIDVGGAFTVNGGNFKYDKATAAAAGGAQTISSIGTVNLAHTHTVTVNIGTHSHTVTIS